VEQHTQGGERGDQGRQENLIPTRLKGTGKLIEPTRASELQEQGGDKDRKEKGSGRARQEHLLNATYGGAGNRTSLPYLAGLGEKSKRTKTSRAKSDGSLHKGKLKVEEVAQTVVKKILRRSKVAAISKHSGGIACGGYEIGYSRGRQLELLRGRSTGEGTCASETNEGLKNAKHVNPDDSPSKRRRRVKPLVRRRYGGFQGTTRVI